MARKGWTAEQLEAYCALSHAIREPVYSDRLNSKGQRLFKWYSNAPHTFEEVVNSAMEGRFIPFTIINNGPLGITVAVGTPRERESILTEEQKAFKDGTILKILKAIQLKRRSKPIGGCWIDWWLDMPILADAMEDAGFSDPIILRWCRNPNDVTAGKVVKAILGRW